MSFLRESPEKAANLLFAADWALLRNRSQPTLLNLPIYFMSQHRSLKGASTITAKRNVLKRFERVELLKKRGQFKAGDKVIGLRKTQPEA